jgi:hypothetical protein
MKWITKTNYWAILCLVSSLTFGQRIENTGAIRSPNGSRYVRLLYDNDYFTKTDTYYTQGYTIEWVSPLLRKNPLTKTLIRFKNGSTRYGLAFDHYGFTPTSIESDEILYGDRPFASFIAIKTFSMSVDTAKKTRVTAALSLGMIGPVAFAEAMQRGIHSLINGIKPHGWQFQIQNDAAITYEVNYEKQLYAHRNIFLVNSNAQLRIGTLNDKASAGLTVIVGKIHSPFAAHSPQKFQFYFYAQPLVSLIGYDATLQGGLFTKSPYTLNVSQINHTTFQANAGFVLQYKKLHLEYAQSYLTQEFKGIGYHRWGGVRIGVLF